MTEREEHLSSTRLKELLQYNPETGIFSWRIDRNSYGGRAKAGTQAGQLDTHGHRIICIDRRRYMAHRLAWFYIHGGWPADQIDHIDMIRDNNRIANLRIATMTHQRANQHVRKDSKSGLKGVQKRCDNRWRARITFRGTVYNLGHSFETPEAAHAAYVKKAEELFGEFARAA